MGFDGKRKPVLESIMNHHGLLVGPRSKLSSEDMRSEIIFHIASGHCIQHPRPWITSRTQTACSAFEAKENSIEHSCDDFVHDADLKQNDHVNNEIKIMDKVLQKHASRNFLLHFLRCKDIPHDPSHSCKHLQLTLARFLRLLEKRPL